MNPSHHQETKSPAEVAEAIVERFNIDSCDWTDYPTRELIAAITTALENERERAAGYIEAKVDQLAEGNIHELTADEALRIATAIRGK